MNKKDDVYLKIKDTGNLPILPEVLLKLLSACDNEDTAISEISDIIKRDPSLSAKILQLVNSAYYGLRHTLSTIDQAVVYLGANTIKNLAVTTSIHQFFNKKQGKGAKWLEQDIFWYQSLMCGCICRQVAEKTEEENADEAYLGGLLHNIGMLILASTFVDEYQTIAKIDTKAGKLLELEEQILGVNHCEAGSWLVRQWNFNPGIADAILHHHAPPPLLQQALLVKIVHTAACLLESHMMGEDHFETCHEIPGLSQTDLEKIVDEAEKEVDVMATNLGIPISPKQKIREHAEIAADADAYVGKSAPDTLIPNLTQEQMSARVRNISLASVFLDQLIQADSIDAMLNAFEKSMNVVFNIGNVLFFWPDSEDKHLTGHTSAENHLQKQSGVLSYNINQDTSRIVTAYVENTIPGYITKTQKSISPIDEKVLSVIDSYAALPITLQVRKSAIGVLVLGLTQQSYPLPDNDIRLLKTLSRQLSISMQLEKERINKANDLYNEKMAAISITARKFAHEINNPLGIVSNYLAFLKLKIQDGEEILDDLDIIEEEIKRIGSMVDEMQMFSQPPISHFEPVDLYQLISEIVHMAESTIFTHPDLNVAFTPGTDVPSIITSKDAIKQILINLLKNSAEAMADGGAVVIRTLKRTGTSTDTEGGVKIIVSDNGPGMSDRVKDNLFKPFTTTKQNNHSGLGLSIVHKTVTDIGGELSCASAEGQGTTFTITLPTRAPGSIREKR